MKNGFSRIWMAACAALVLGAAQAACEEPDLDDEGEGGYDNVYARDPNEITGSPGVGADRWVRRGERLSYVIYFENETNATASAQTISVTLPEDPSLDWSTLRLGEVAMGQSVDRSLEGRGAGSSASAPIGDGGWTVRTTVEEAAGSLKWTMRIWDPATEDHFPEDVYAGILPPNNPTNHCGEGHVAFSVCVKTNAVAGAKAAAAATIVFDANPPIATDPSWWNTVGLDIAVLPFADGIGYVGPYDGLPHGIDVVVTSPASGATVKYCDVQDGEYGAEPVTYAEVGTNTVWFLVEAPGHVPHYGSAKVVITPTDDAPVPLEPGDETGALHPTEAAARAAAERLYVAFPRDLADIATADERAAYTNLFHIVQRAVPSADGAAWRNVAVFTPAAVASLRASLDAALRGFDLSRITVEDTEWVVPNPVKGLYYALERTDSLAEGFGTHSYDLATSVDLVFNVNETGKRSGFFRLVVSACPPEVRP